MHRSFHSSKHSMTHSPCVGLRNESGLSYLPMLAILAIMSIGVGLFMTIGRSELAVESHLVKTAFERGSTQQSGNGAPILAQEPPAE